MQNNNNELQTIDLQQLESVNGGLPGETWAQFGERYGGAIGGYLGPLGREAGRDIGNWVGRQFDPAPAGGQGGGQPSS